MAIQLIKKLGGKVLEVQVSGKLSHEDYVHFTPKFEEQIKVHGKIRVLFDMVDFHGWKAEALWDDVKLDLKHSSDIERLAIVGDKEWEKGMSSFCRPFTSAEIRYFDQSQKVEAREWIESETGGHLQRTRTTAANI